MSRRFFDIAEVSYAVMAILFAYYFGLRHLQTPQWGPASFARLVAGSGVPPMQYRALIPWVVRGIRAVAPPGFSDVSLDTYRLTLDLASCVAVVYSTRWLLRCAGFTRLHALAGSWMVPFVLPFHFLIPPVTRYYPYDLPAIAFFTVCLGLLIQQRWRPFYPLFIIATFNRERRAS